MSSNIAISVRNLGKMYPIFDKPVDRLKQMLWGGYCKQRYGREHWALRDISFDVKKGETIGVIGRNGAGKSTLLQLINGTLTPTTGSLSCSGRITGLLELGAGFNAEFTGRENVFLNGSILGMSKEQVLEKFDSIAAFADIGDFMDQSVKTYSTGMMMRLAFAVVAHLDPEILIVDEALAVGDAFFFQKCMRFLRKFQENGVLFFATHDTGAISNLCSRAIWLENGTVRAMGDPKSLAEAYLESVYKELQGPSRIKVGASAVPKSPSTRSTPPPLRPSSAGSIDILDFNPETPSFGLGNIKIERVFLTLAGTNQVLIAINGGEMVTLVIECVASHPIASPIIGFLFKDHLGQHLFSENTFLSYQHTPLSLEAGQRLKAEFTFEMPFLRAADYSITAAVAEGTQENHVQHHWIHDALIVKSHANKVAGGIIGLPMRSVNLVVCENVNVNADA